MEHTGLQTPGCQRRFTEHEISDIKTKANFTRSNLADSSNRCRLNLTPCEKN